MRQLVVVLVGYISEVEADMTLPSQGFSVIEHYLLNLKTIINLQKCSVQSCYHRHKGSYTGDLHLLLLQP